MEWTATTNMSKPNEQAMKEGARFEKLKKTDFLDSSSPQVKRTINISPSNEKAKKVYAEFQAKVKKTIFLDNLSPQVTDAVIRTALGQFGEVLSMEFIPNYTIPYPIPNCALVEMENRKQASSVIAMMNEYPFMMSGMPRPVRALPAKAEMFADRPSPPDRNIKVQWLEPSDPKFRMTQKLKALCKQHTAESLQMVKVQLQEEENLAKHQKEILDLNCKKHDLIYKIQQDGSMGRLARHYGLLLKDE